MSKLLDTHKRRARAQARVRAKISSGTAARPRLNVYMSLTNVTAQLIDDASGTTLASATSIGSKEAKGKNLTEKSVIVAGLIAKAGGEKKISTVVFDRGRHTYHGRIKAFAEAARAGGLKF